MPSCIASSGDFKSWLRYLVTLLWTCTGSTNGYILSTSDHPVNADFTAFFQSVTWALPTFESWLHAMSSLYYHEPPRVKRVVSCWFKEPTCYQGVVACKFNKLTCYRKGKIAMIRMKFKVNHKHAVRIWNKLKCIQVCLPKDFGYLKNVVNYGEG